MPKVVSLKQVQPFLDEILKMGGSVCFMPNGKSMLPLIREGKDSVVLGPVKRPLKKHDIILYTRDDGQYVLHRIVKVRKNDYVLCGDNQTKYEFGINDSMVIGIVTSLKRGEVLYSVNNKEYKKYCKKLYIKRKKVFLHSLLIRIYKKII